MVGDPETGIANFCCASGEAEEGFLADEHFTVIISSAKTKSESKESLGIQWECAESWRSDVR